MRWMRRSALRGSPGSSADSSSASSGPTLGFGLHRAAREHAVARGRPLDGGVPQRGLAHPGLALQQQRRRALGHRGEERLDPAELRAAPDHVPILFASCLDPHGPLPAKVWRSKPWARAARHGSLDAMTRRSLIIALAALPLSLTMFAGPASASPAGLERVARSGLNDSQPAKDRF